MEYPLPKALELLASDFVDAGLFAAAMGGGKDDPDAVRRYLELPIPSRPDVAWYFDRAWYLLRYPDIARGDFDPLLHFVGWGVAEARAPHPLIEPRFMREADPELLPDPITIDALLDALDRDRIDPSPRFSLVDYRAQLDADPPGGLLRHFLQYGLTAGLRPSPGLDPVGAWRAAKERTTDIRSGLRHAALAGPAARDAEADPPSEGAAKALFLLNARALAATAGRAPIDFTYEGEPALSVLMVVHGRFALTMATLASLRANFAGAMDVVVIDSGSDDETRHLGQYVRGARILRFEDNIGFLQGSNAALQFAVAPLLLYLNNDIALAPGAIAAALRRMEDASIGAVGAKIIRSHGALQEAGSIVWRDGWATGYMRDASPLAPEANFVRDVDFCSAAFLLARAEPVRALDGFDPAFAPGYYEDADLCLGLAAAGLRVVYDPAIVVWHLEHGSSDGAAAAAAMIAARRDIFFRKHRARLRFRYAADARAALFARGTAPARGRVLFIEDQVPLRRLGQGFGRSRDIIAALAASGRHVTVYPVYPSRVDPAAIAADLPDTVEVMHDRGLDALEGFLRARRGYYDTIWIARTHNLARVKPVLERGGTDVLGGVRIVLDTEAIAALREAARREALGEAPLDVEAALAEEFADAWFCQAVVAVSEAEAARLRGLGFPDVAVLGHARAPAPTPRGFAEREGMLFVGALEVAGSPNHDALLWFVDAVLPLIEAELGYQTRLTVAGHVGGVDLSPLESHPRVTLLGPVADLTPLYDRARLFVAPARFAAGIPRKLHDAAALGLPSVASTLLAGQLGWADGAELLAVPVGDAEAFARAVLSVYRDAALWATLREGALRRVERECDVEAFRAVVEGIAGEGAPAMVRLAR